MKRHAQVVVIGGGVVGCSVLYHLAKLGWKDIVLVERKRLTAGSSWHAAGGFHAINSDPNVARLQAYTISLYREIEQISGQDIGMHLTGGLNVAATRERWDLLRAEWARHRVLGLDTSLLGAAEVGRMCPIIDIHGIQGALYDPNEGHIDPAGVTDAYAKAARKLGAEIIQQTRVASLTSSSTGGWTISTEHGELEAEHVVNAGGLWAREVGWMVGVELPLIPMEHHYIVTEDIPELLALNSEIPLIADLDGEIYMRQERKGVLLGVYEREATPWAADGTPWDYGETDLLPPNLDRIAEALAHGFKRFPSLQRAGIRRIVNGPFTFTPDGNPLVGPVSGLRNYWVACGVMAGFAQGGGVGLALAQWMIRGEPESDILAMDVARFGDFATRGYTRAKACEFYSRRFQLSYPNEFWPAGRPAKTSALYHRMNAAGAVNGVSFGLEVPMYFARAGEARSETPSLRRSNAFSNVTEECVAVRNAVGFFDTASFAKYEVSGSHASAWLDELLAGKLPEVGRVRLAPMLSESGRLMGDLTLMQIAEDRFLLFGSGYLQSWHMRWFESHLPADGVRLRNISDEWGGVAIAGPRSRELLSRLTRLAGADLELPFLSVRQMDVALAPAVVARLSITGELGYEIYVPVKFAVGLAEQLDAAAEGLGARDIGVYALNSLRLEKSYGIWSREFSRDYTPRASGLWRYVDYDKRHFIGRDAALRDRDTSPARQLVAFAIDSADADAWGFEPVWFEGVPVGYTTSGGYGHSVGKSLAMGYLRSDLFDSGAELHVSIVGEKRPARLLAEPAFDPRGVRLRA